MNQCHIAIYKQTTLPGLCLSVPPLDFFFFLLMSCTTLYQHLIKEKKSWIGEVSLSPRFLYIHTHTHFVFKEWFEYSLECAFLQAFQNANWILNDNMWKHKINAELCPITSTHICCNNYFPQSEDTKANKATCLLCSEISLMLQVSKCGQIFFYFLFFFCLIRSLLFRFDTF